MKRGHSLAESPPLAQTVLAQAPDEQVDAILP